MPEESALPTQPERTRIQLCGRLSVEIDGAQLADSLRGKQVPLLLAYLALHRHRGIPREELSAVLWPERAPRSQDGALRTLLSRLRSALGVAVVQGREQLALVLPEPAWIDVEAAAAGVERALESLEAGDARAAWALAQVPLNVCGRGLLPGLQADWLEPARRELEDLRMEALEVVGRAGLLLGGSQLQSAERTARALIDTEPYRESGYVLLMQALAAEGNVAEALRVFDRLRTLLRDELGTAPSRETIAAHERLLKPPAARPAPAQRSPSPGARIEFPVELRTDVRVPFVGRRGELEALNRLWAIVHGPHPTPEVRSGRLTLVYGEPGVGKTRLVAEAARGVHEQGAIVLAGRATQEALVSYQPILEAIRHYVRGAPLEQLRSVMDEHGPELAHVVPELRRRLPELDEPDADEQEPSRFRLFEAVAGALAAIETTAPLLLVLDDLHWADRPTLQLLHHLARAPLETRIPILGTYRASEADRGGAFSEALADLRHEELALEIEIEGLSERETAELVRARTGAVAPVGFIRALHRQTEGNPLFLSQIMRELRQAGVDFATAGAADLNELGLPEDLRRTIARRLSGLSPQAEEMLRAAAVIGREFEVSLLEGVAALSEEELIAALEEALAAGVLVERLVAEDGFSRQRAGLRGTLGSERYLFSHVLIRETLYEEMSALRRARLHRRVGEALERLPAAADGEERLAGERVAMLARHFTAAAGAEDAEQAIRYARRAAERASETLSYEEAAEHYERALAVLERFRPDDERLRLELLLSLAEAYVRSGDRPLAWEPLRDAAELSIALNDSDGLARAAVAASRRYVQRPGVVDEELISLLERALEMTAGQVSTLRVRLLARMCGALYYASQPERLEALSAEATEIATSLGEPEARALAAAARRRSFWSPSRLEQRLTDSAEVLRFGREANDIELTLQGHAWLVVDLLELGDLEAVDGQIETFTEGARRLRQPLYLWQAEIWRAMRVLLSGDLAQADELASRALATGARAEAVTAAQYYSIQLLAIRRDQGRMAELEPAVKQLIERFPNRVAYRAVFAVLLAETGRLDEARAEVDFLARDGFAAIPDDLDWLTSLTLLADVCPELGDAQRCEQLYELLRPYAEVNVVIGLATVCEGAAARHLGRLATAIGREREAVDHLTLALERNQALKAPICLARTQLDYAAALGPGAEASELVRAAAQAAAALGLPPIQRRVALWQEKFSGQGLKRALPSPHQWPRHL